MQALSTDQILIGFGLLLVLAVGSQVLASQLRIPALIILLPAGFIAGAVTDDVNPDRLLASADGAGVGEVPVLPGARRTRVC
jgi:NhaP-type Na+/H+ or K+/H+ antiporter